MKTCQPPGHVLSTGRTFFYQPCRTFLWPKPTGWLCGQPNGTIGPHPAPKWRWVEVRTATAHTTTIRWKYVFI